MFRRIFGYLGVASLFIGVIGMFFVGIFNLDWSPFDLHLYFSTSAFGGFAVGAFFTGLAIVLRKRIFPKSVGYFMIFGPSVASIIFIICPAPLTRQFLIYIKKKTKKKKQHMIYGDRDKISSQTCCS